MKNHNDCREEVKELSIRLRSIGEYLEDTGQTQSNTGYVMKRASYWLEKLSKNMCNMGYIGHTGGNCNSDSHK